MRKSGLIGVVFAVTYTVGLFLDNGPAQKLADAQTDAWYGSHSLGLWLVSSAIIAVAGLCALGFSLVLSRRVAGSDAGATGSLLSGAGAVAAALVMVGAGLFGAIPAQHAFNHAPLPTAATSRVMLGAAYAMIVLVAPLAFGVMMFCVSLLALRNRTLPRWLAVAGFPLAVLQLANAVAPMVTLVLWSILTGVTLAVRRPAPVLAAHVETRPERVSA
jgi:hypothetical protein